MNYLLVGALREFHRMVAPGVTVPYATGTAQRRTLAEVADDLERRLPIPVVVAGQRKVRADRRRGAGPVTSVRRVFRCRRTIGSAFSGGQLRAGPLIGLVRSVLLPLACGQVFPDELTRRTSPPAEPHLPEPSRSDPRWRWPPPCRPD